MLPGIEFGQWISALTLSEVLSAVLGYVEALAWPVTVAFGVWIFRTPLANLFPRLTKISAFGVESSFNDQARVNARAAESVKEAVEAVGTEPAHDNIPEQPRLPEEPPVSPDVSNLTPTGVDLAFDEQDPSILGVFISRWNRLEHVAEQTFERLDLEVKPGHYRRIANLSQTFGALAKAGLVPPRAAEVAAQTQRLRNEVVHGRKDLSLDALDDVLASITALEQTLKIAGGRMAVEKIGMNQVMPSSSWR